ncbi:Midasin [Sphaceloma murrayae]|uniref:Midasin n=1 Tax=Sphaceloma murrayae TaxID=2082308 RepID=A0A2K1QS42_9PEZI|nr:Midasin [Sphaceloma murrayae]
MAGDPLRSPSHRASFSDHEDLPYIPYRHVRPGPAGYPVSTETSVSSRSSLDDEPSDHIDPEDSASRDRPPRSHISVRSPRSAVPPAPHRAASILSHHSSHRGAPLPPQQRPESREGSHYRRVVRERSVSRERRVRHEAPPYPVHDDRRPPPPQREESGSSMDSSESSSYDGPVPSRPYDPRYGQPHYTGYPPHQQPYPFPRRPSHNYPEYAAPGALMHMPPPDPYYRDRYGHGPYAMSPPADPYYPPSRPHRPRPTSYHDPHYQDAMVPVYQHPHHHHHYPPQLPVQPINYFNPPAPAPAPAPPAPAKSPAPPTPKEDDPELKRLQAELAMIKAAQVRDEERQRQDEHERKIRLEAELATLKKLKEQQEADKRRADEISAAEKAAKEQVEADMKEKAKKTQEENDKKAAEEKKKMDELEKKKKDLEEEIKKSKGDPDAKKPPVRLKDSVLERKFDFPWTLAKKWNETLKLLEQAYESVPDLHRRILESRFELVGPDRQIILPSVWETTIQPGWEITLLMPPEPHMGMGVDPYGPLPGMMEGTFLDPGKKKHKSSSKDKKSSRDKDGKKKKRDPQIVSYPDGGLPVAPAAGMPPGMMAGGPFAANQSQPLFGQGPMPPPIGAMEFVEPVLGKDDRGKSKKSSGKKSSGGGGFFGLGARKR